MEVLSILLACLKLQAAAAAAQAALPEAELKRAWRMQNCKTVMEMILVFALVRCFNQQVGSSEKCHRVVKVLTLTFYTAAVCNAAGMRGEMIGYQPTASVHGLFCVCGVGGEHSVDRGDYPRCTDACYLVSGSHNTSTC
jgi:hypothetical protein